MIVTKLDSCGQETKSHKFTKPLRATLGGKNIALQDGVQTPLIRRVSLRILAAIPLFTIGLPYTIPACIAILATPKHQIYPPPSR